MQQSVKQHQPASVPVKPISRGTTIKHERRTMVVTAYTANDRGMDGKGITASGELVQEGRTIAADPSVAFGTKIYIPEFEKTYTVTDRGGAIRGDRLDLYMEKRSDAIEFGVWELEVWIKK
ncbi:3D domain-containing protein [Desulfosporosinus nitroreducens]|uniref:3D domain-containing protein n=1 Tax=Desulfosporosinus nitroreducens TaxID=2018668 RepID=UPI00207CAE17|nr:3D domain-containing protein [Desulfosporosinus nitroreducens]MCO1599782.1 3D domain-containing protein [Desulfosporosinus nitroreducens]